MNRNPDESTIRLSLLNSVDREELLIKKYEALEISTHSNEWKTMLKEFKKCSEEHLDLIKNKLQKFNS